MNENTLLQSTNIIGVDEETKKEQELLNTIRMEPILEKTVMEEEPELAKKKKKIKAIDYILMTLIVLVSVAFVMVILKVR